MNPDGKKITALHRKIIRDKKLLNLIYRDFYLLFKKAIPRTGKIVEIGSGGGFVKEIIPQVLTGDLVSGMGIDKVFSVGRLPFKTESISAFLLLNTFHHIKNPENALIQMQRALKKGGKIIMIEPYNSVWGRFIYRNFHHEDFITGSSWKISGKGRLSAANGALPWIIFVRDRQKFEQKFPDLKIVNLKPHTPFLYLLSGGLSKPQLIPDIFYETAKKAEQLLSPLNKYLGMFMTIEIKKIK